MSVRPIKRASIRFEQYKQPYREHIVNIVPFICCRLSPNTSSVENGTKAEMDFLPVAHTLPSLASKMTAVYLSSHPKLRSFRFSAAVFEPPDVRDWTQRKYKRDTSGVRIGCSYRNFWSRNKNDGRKARLNLLRRTRHIWHAASQRNGQFHC